MNFISFLVNEIFYVKIDEICDGLVFFIFIYDNIILQTLVINKI